MLAFYLSLVDAESEKETLADIYGRCKYACLHVALQITHRQDLAEDAVHNAFLEVVKRKEILFSLPCGKRKSRIVIITKNKAIDLMRKENRSLPYGEEEFMSDEPDFTLKIENEEMFERAVRAIDQLPEVYRLTAQLRYCYDMEYAGIAREQGISVKAVSMRLSRAKRIIQETMRKEDANHAF